MRILPIYLILQNCVCLSKIRVISEINGMLDDLCNFANNNDVDIFVHPIIRGIIIHFVLSFIHPFCDGNGRTARLLVYWYLLKNKYWFVEYLSISRIIYRSKSRYERAFLCVENDNYDLSYFIWRFWRRLFMNFKTILVERYMNGLHWITLFQFQELLIAKQRF